MMPWIHGVALAEAPSAQNAMRYSLQEIIDVALKHNPRFTASGKDIEIEDSAIRSARATRRPTVDLVGSAAKYRYPNMVTPFTGPPTVTFSGGTPQIAGFPEFDDTIYDVGVSFRMPLYRGGRLYRMVAIAEIRKAIAEDRHRLTRQELVYNLAVLYYKINQIEKLAAVQEASVRQLLAHRKDVEFFLKEGTAPRVELLKIETEVSHAEDNLLLVKNNLANTYEILWNLMGVQEPSARRPVEAAQASADELPSTEVSVKKAYSQRPDYQAVLKTSKIAEEKIRIARGRRYPEISVGGDYIGRSGDRFDFNENWNVGLRMSIPLFEGGSISADVAKAAGEADKAVQEERALRLDIERDVRQAYRSIEDAAERMKTARKAIDTAREAAMIENLKYETGAGKTADVIDAQTALLRAERDYYQAMFDREIAIVALQRATGDTGISKEGSN